MIKRIKENYGWFALFAALVATVVVYAATTDTEVSRLKLAHPDLGHDGGSVLHGKVRTAWTKIGDNMNSRYFESSAIADSTTTAYDHNFGVAFNELTTLIYTGAHPNLTRVADPAASGWVIAATTGSEKTSIDVTTPGSGGPHTYAVVIIQGSAVEVLDDLDDVDVTTTSPEDGQALVYNATGSEWVPGASGDSSFKCQSITDPTLTIKSGYIILDSGVELQIASDLAVNLDTVLGSDPADATTYYLYADLETIPAASLLANGRQVRVVSLDTHFSLQTDLPDAVLQTRYVPLCFIRSADTGTVWSGTGSAFDTLAIRRHGRPVVNVNPTVYELAKQSQGEPGIVNNTRGTLTESFFPDTTSLQFWSFNGDTNGGAATSPINLTQNGSPAFDVTGIFGGDILRTTSATSGAYSDDAFFQMDPSMQDFSLAAWVGGGVYNDGAVTYNLFGIGDPGGSAMFQIEVQGALARIADNAGLTFLTNHLVSGEMYHFAYTYDASASTKYLYLNGELVASHVGALTNVANERFTVGLGRSLAGGKADNTFEEVFFKKTLLTDTEIKELYSRRFEGNQVALGHVITDESLPSYTTDLSYYNLTSVTDNSTNSRTLTNTGSVSFTGVDIFGVNTGIAVFDGTNTLERTDTFYTDAVSSGSWAFGGLFKADDWKDAGTLYAIRENAPNLGPRVESFSDDFYISASTDGTAITIMQFPVPDYFVDGSWHHLMMAYDGTELIFYIDGNKHFSQAFDGQAAITAPFTIGSRYAGGSPGGYFTGGEAQDFIFASKGLTDAEIKRLASAKITHNKNVPVENQTWLGSFWNEQDDLVGEFDQDWLVHKTANALFIDPALPAGSQLTLKMQNQSFTSTTVPVETYNTGLLSSAPSFPISHGLPCTPQDFYVLTEGQTTAGDWDKRYDLLSADATTILGDVSSLTIDGSHRLQIIASCAPVALALDLENADLLITNNTLSKDLIIGSGKTFFRPNLEIASGNTLTVNGTFNTVGEITGSGTLAGTGTVSSIDEQQVFTPNKTFQGNLDVEGDTSLKGNLDTSGSLSGLIESGDPGLSITGLNNASGGTMIFDKYSRVGNVVNFSFATTMDPTAARWDFTLQGFPWSIAAGQGACSGVGSAQTGANHTICTVVDLSTSTAKVWCDDTSDNANPANQTIYFTFQCQIQ